MSVTLDIFKFFITMNNSLNYYSSLLQNNKTLVDVEYWQTVQSLYTNKKPKESTIALLRYTNPIMFEKYGNTEKTYFEIPHGSIFLKIKITDEVFSVEAPFLELPKENVVPLLRHVAEINFYPLNLPNITLKENQLVFEYMCPIETAEPYKIWDVLYEICTDGDTYDDKFIRQFKAKRIYEPKIQRFSEDELQEKYEILIKIIDEAINYINYFYSKRWDYFCWDIVAISLFKIDHHIVPQGNLRIILEEEINYQMKTKDPHQKRVSSALAFFEKIKNTPVNEIKDDIYMIETFISPRRRATYDTLVNAMKETYTRATSEYTKKDDIACTISVLYIYFYTLYYYNFEDKYLNEIINALKQSSGKPWTEAATILYLSLQRIMLNTVPEVSTSQNNTKQENKKGNFFSKLFGK